MKVSIHEWREVIDTIAELTYEVLQHSPSTRRKDRTVEGVTNWVRALEFDDFFTSTPVVVVAHDKGKAIGWLMLCSTGSKTAEVVPWGLSIRPVISPDHDRTEVATQLLEKARNWARKEGIDSILLRTDAEPGQEQDITWYQSLGFTVREETVCMNYCITGDEKDHERPKGFDLKQITRVDREDLYYCYYDTFTEGQSPFFFDQNEDEKRASFDLLFETECADTDMSLAIVKDSQIVGFSFVRPYGDEGNILLEWIGIHPEYRRRGLGEFLLRHIMKSVSEKGYTTVRLSCAVGNTRAFNLYLKTGWEVEGGEIIFSLKI